MSAIQPVTEAFSKHGDNLVILYGDDDRGEFYAVAVTINQTVFRRERITNLPTLDPGGTLQYGIFGENGHSADVSDPGDDVLTVEADQPETIIEYGIAVQPDDVLIGLEISGEPVIGFQGPTERINVYNNSPDELVKRGFVKSQNTVTDTAHGSTIPTTALSPTNRQGIIRFDAGDGTNENNIRTMFKNVSDEPAPLSAVAYGQAYHIVPVQDPEITRDMYFGDGYMRRTVEVGGFENTNPSIPDAWQEGEVLIDAPDQAGRRERGGN